MVHLYAFSDNVAGKNAGVALLYIFLFFYATGIDVGTYIYLGEMFPNHLRVKGVGISLAALNVTATIFLSLTATAFSAIGWKYFMVSNAFEGTQKLSSPISAAGLTRCSNSGIRGHHLLRHDLDCYRPPRNPWSASGGD